MIPEVREMQGRECPDEIIPFADPMTAELVLAQIPAERKEQPAEILMLVQIPAELIPVLLQQ